MDAINALRNKQQKAFSKPLAQILKNKDLSGVDSQSKVIDMLTQEELNELISQTPNDAMDKKTLYVIYLKYGIAKHNLEGEESTIITEDLIDRILDGTKLSAEIYEIIEGFNSFFTSASK